MRTPTFDTQCLAALFLVAVVAVAAWTALSGAAAGEVRLVPCPVHAVTGVACPGCGMTRACVALAHGEVASAWSFHPFAFLLVPLALCFAVAPGGTRQMWASVPDRVRTVVVTAGLVLCLGLWATRAL
ncbi:MAG: DUF2752 domain-containing protein [bacterium]|nr:DUF2752 domain-containing protein [bacterium]